MKKSVLLAAMLALSLYASAQVVPLFQESFESGTGNWTLNGGSGTNTWVVNNQYAGGLFGIIVNTPQQPAVITGSPTSNYLHITNGDICSILSICNANFDTGSPSDQTATLNNSISTLNLQNVTFAFYYLCAGDPASAYGSLEYSLDNGTTWTVAGMYNGVSSWTTSSISLPIWDNQPSLRFRFRWQNGSLGSDPAFSVDDVVISAMSAATPAVISLNAIPATSWCFNTLFNTPVHFTSSGTYFAANVYNAELSDATGSFATPLNIGTLATSATGNLTINGIIPAGTPAGSGYRIRVVSTDQPAVSNDNGADLSIHTLPVIDGGPDRTVCAGSSVTLTATGAVQYGWTNSVINASPFTPAATQTYTVTGTDANGCQGTDQVTVTVDPCLGLDNSALTDIRIYPNPVQTDFTLQLPPGETEGLLSITDLSGKVLRNFKVTADMSTYSIGDLPAGSYLLLFKGRQNTFSTGILKYK